MPTRTKTGGRKKGTPNKATAARQGQAAEDAPAAPKFQFTASRARARGAQPTARPIASATMEPASDGGVGNRHPQAPPPKVEKGAAAQVFPEHRIERVADLIPYARNARTHSPDQVKQIAGSIREFGFTNPVLIDGERGIIAGHGRVMAAELLGLETVPVIVLDHLTDAQRRAYVITDNKLALNAGWDDDLLRLELGELRDLDNFDLNLVGFGDVELKALFDDDEGAGGGGKSGAGSLAERFGVPPFSVLSAREGWWQARKAAWIAIGIQSELGRGENLIGRSATEEEYRSRTGRFAAVPGGGSPLPTNRARASRANATPGGSKMPAADYSKGQRGDGRGRAA